MRPVYTWKEEVGTRMIFYQGGSIVLSDSAKSTWSTRDELKGPKDKKKRERGGVLSRA